MSRALLALFPVYFATFIISAAEPAAPRSPTELLAGAVQKLAAIVEPAADAKPTTFSARVELVKAGGLPKELVGQSARIAFQAPDRATISVTYKNEAYSIGRDGQDLWGHVTGKKFGVVGKPGQQLYLSNPDKLDSARLGPVKLPLPREQLALLPLLMNLEARPDEKVGGMACHVLRVTPKPEATEALKIPRSTIHLWLRQSDLLPLRIGYEDGAKLDVLLELVDIRFDDAWPESKWKIPAREGDKVETAALGHLMRFVPVALGMLTAPKIPVLGPATGERKVVATEGKGRYEMVDGTRVLYLEGTPQEMGAQHGALLRREIKQLERIKEYYSHKRRTS